MKAHLLLQQIQRLVAIIGRERKALDAHRELTRKIANDPRSPYAQQARAILARDQALMAANQPDQVAIEALGDAAQAVARPAQTTQHRSPPPRSPDWLDRIGDWFL